MLDIAWQVFLFSTTQSLSLTLKLNFYVKSYRYKWHIWSKKWDYMRRNVMSIVTWWHNQQNFNKQHQIKQYYILTVSSSNIDDFFIFPQSTIRLLAGSFRIWFALLECALILIWDDFGSGMRLCVHDGETNPINL